MKTNSNSGLSLRRLVILAAFALSISAAFAKLPDGFLSTWEDVQKSAKERHVMIYLHFTTDWCGWCRKIESDTYPDAKVKKELADNFAAASLDCTVPQGKAPSENVKTNMNLFNKFGGGGYPFLVILGEDGVTVYQTIGGYMEPTSFLQKLKEAKQTEKDYQAFQEYAAKADKTTYDYAQRAMRMMTRVKRTSEAIAMAKKVCELDPYNKKGDILEAAWIILQNTNLEKWTTDGKVYTDLIIKFDADNSKRYLEQMYWTQALEYFGRKQNAKCIAVLEDLIKSAKTLQNAQDVQGMLGIVYCENGNKEKGIATLEAAIKLNPTSSRGKWLQQKLDGYKK